MTPNDFFDKAEEHSVVKANIVAKYFDAWANVMLGATKGAIRYMDLFAGKGRYDDGTPSTPMLVLKKAIQDDRLCTRLKTVFNDRDEDYVVSLRDAVGHLDDIGKLAYAPAFFCQEVSVEFVKSVWEEDSPPPTLLFVDPWGYKGVSLALVKYVLPSFGCDCIMFFNYRRINASLNNQTFQQHMADLFGEERARALSSALEFLDPEEREKAVIEGFSQALRSLGGRYVLPFGFKSDTGRRTTHHLIFVSKHPLGYKIMKEIMAKESTSGEQGVPSFEYNPADQRYPLLFELSRPLDDLKGILLTRFEGRRMTMNDVYNEHNVDTPFIEANYKDALRDLEVEGRIQCDPPATKRPKRNGIATFGGKVYVSFPRRNP